jgi:hypothetical protein
VPRLEIALLAGLLLSACPRTQAPTTTPIPPAAPLPLAAAPSDPLRDPRELHLKGVRQVSFGSRASWPRYSADGKLLFFIEERLDDKGDAGKPTTALLRVVEPRSGAAIPRATPASARGSLRDLWRDPSGSICGDLAQGLCGPDDLVNPAGATCSGLLPVALEKGTCTPPAVFKGRVGTCAASAQGVWACLQGSEQGPVLWLTDLGQPPPRPVLPAPGWDSSPAFSPDGKSLAWSSSKHPGLGPEDPSPGRPPMAQIFVLPVAGGGAARTLTSTGTNLTPTWFPDSSRLLFASNADDAAGQEFDLAVISAEGTALQRVTFAPGTDLMPTFSPDGREVAWVSERNAAHPSERNLLVADWVD